jgi:hypothetical protein
LYQASSGPLFFVEAGTPPVNPNRSGPGERVTDMLTANKLMVALVGSRSRAVPDTVPDDAEAHFARARSRERIVLVHRTLARRRQRVIAARRLP